MIATVAKYSTDRRLAPIYGRVMELHDAGVSDEAIAVTVGVAVEAVPALIEVAVRKHAHHADAHTPRTDERA
jgi:hypothetical protein